MNVFKTSLLATALIAGGVIAPANAAESAPDYFDVTITIAKSCDITATTNVAFGSQLASTGTVTPETDGSVTVECTVDIPYDVALNGGLHSGNDISARQMLHTNGTDSIAYDLLQTDGGVAWGETVGTNTVSGIGTGFGPDASTEPHIVYAEATITGTERVGDYSDTITATVTF